MRIVLGSDHAGFPMRRDLAAALAKDGFEIVETGSPTGERSDYPCDADETIAAMRPGDFAILVCGSGIGISVRANRYPHVVCALCTTELMARLAREHNHANALALGARITGPDQALAIARAFLDGSPSEEPRHVHRIELLDAPLGTCALSGEIAAEGHQSAAWSV